MLDIVALVISLGNWPMYFAMMLGVPSMALYIAEIVTLLRHKKFRSSFYLLFVFRAIQDLVYVGDSFYMFRLPSLFGALLRPLYSSFPNWALALSQFLNGYAYHAMNWATAFMLLNRLTAIALPIRHEKLWKRLLLPCAATIFAVPFLCFLPMFRADYFLNSSNPNSTGFNIWMDPYMNYLNRLNVACSATFMVVCGSINLAALVAYKRSTVSPLQSNIERKLLVYTLLTFAGHAIFTGFQIAIYVFELANDQVMMTFLGALYAPVIDVNTVVLSSWLLLWASDLFREQLCRDLLPKWTLAKTKAATGGTNSHPPNAIQVQPKTVNNFVTVNA